MKYTLYVILCSLLISDQIQPMVAGPSQLQRCIGVKATAMITRAVSSGVDATVSYGQSKIQGHLEALARSRQTCIEYKQQQDEQKKEEERKRRELTGDVIDDVTDAYTLHSLSHVIDKKDLVAHGSSLQQSVQQSESNFDTSIVSDVLDVASSVAETISDVATSIGDSLND